MRYKMNRNTWAYLLPTWIKYCSVIRPSEDLIVNRFYYKRCRAMDGVSKLNEI